MGWSAAGFPMHQGTWGDKQEKGHCRKYLLWFQDQRERGKQVYRTTWKEGREDLATALLKEKCVECSNDGREGQVWMRGKGSDKLETFFLLLSWRWQGIPLVLVLKMNAWSTARRYLDHSKAEITFGNTENRWCHLSEREKVHQKRLQENVFLSAYSIRLSFRRSSYSFSFLLWHYIGG